jgi:hypothetical protein
MDFSHTSSVSGLPRFYPDSYQGGDKSCFEAIDAVIQAMSAAIATDLAALEKVEDVEDTLPTASADNVGKMVVYITGTTPMVRICVITGTDPTAYGFKPLAFVTE